LKAATKTPVYLHFKTMLLKKLKSNNLGFRMLYQHGILIICSLSLITCIDPIRPEYNFFDGLIIIEGQASSTRGTSFITINQTTSEFGIYRNIFQEGATVLLKNVDTGETVVLQELPNTYVPPDDFVVSVGESWELDITLMDGRKYRSLPEKVIEPVPISDISVTYEKELKFRDDSGKFVPGHSIAVSFDDPAVDKNYYFWRFRSFEKLFICEVCTGTIFRDDNCENIRPGFAIAPYYTYICETDCWKIRYNESVEIFDDEFTNGNRIENLPVADVLLYTTEDILVSVEQLSLSFDAYQYYRRLKDVVDNNGNFDAPPPAALVGNISNLNNDDEVVLGRFTATSTSSVDVFIDRTDILEDDIDFTPSVSFETTPPFNPSISIAPCVEGRFRTAVRPEGWIEN